MRFEIIPYKSVGDILFGQSREKIRELLNQQYTEFYRSEFSKIPTDSFNDSGLLISYDENFNCEAIEMTLTANPVFLDRALLKESYSALLKWLLRLEANLEEDDAGFTSHKFGFGVYAPNKEDEPDGCCEGVIAFKKGYYD
jgi:hypothetical protein